MSRADNVGMFWQDIILPKETKRQERGPRPLPPVPETGWTPPREFPRLDSAYMIGVDTETYDPELHEAGPGWARGKGHIVGVSVSATDGMDGAVQSWYFPMRHELGAEMNLNPEHVLAWLRDTLKDARQPKLFTNAIYDLGWLDAEGVHVAGDVHDVQIAEPLLDEYAYSYSLDALSLKYGGAGKPEDALVEWLLEAYGGPKRFVKENIYRAPPSLVGPYAEFDAREPHLIFRQQREELAKQGLLDLYMLEAKLPRILMLMRKRGVRVDLDRAEQVDKELTRRADILLAGDLKGINPNSPSDLERYAKQLGVKPPTTELGNPSFAGKWLAKHMPKVAELRGILKMRDTFVRSYILEKNVNGRVYCQFHQLRGDEGGTVSGRFSSSDPNLQNVPGRDEEFAPMIRGLYIPDEGHRQWRRFDWSQIEYRFLVHFAKGRGSEAAREAYRNDPTTDFHVMAQELIWPGQPEMRKPAKNMNFGIVYGMGEEKMAASLGRSVDEAAPLLDEYHKRFPFVRETYSLASRMAKQRGYVLTYLKRRARFPDGRETHKALNRVLQGSSADIMKLAMVMMYEAGLFDRIGAPALTVHDELDWSDPGDGAANETFYDAHAIMQSCVKLSVPLVADMEAGPNWGNTEKLKKAA